MRLLQFQYTHDYTRIISLIDKRPMKILNLKCSYVI